MADWDSLKPLKNHIAVLVIVAIILAAILLLTPPHAFRASGSNNSYIQDNRVTSTVTAVGGLSIRNQPNKNGSMLTTAPYQAKLTIIDANVAQDYIDGKNGYWYKVEYQGTVGYAWGNYIN